MSTLTVGRIQLGPPLQWQEAIGDPVTTLGGAVVPAPRQAPRHQVSIGTYAADGATDTVAARLVLRARLRALLNNADLKLQGYVYVIYGDDPDLSGWYLPDFGQLADFDGASGLASGFWKLENVNWLQAGHLRTHREARNVWMRDLRTGLPWRDYQRLIYSTDFSALPALLLSALPNGATSAALTVSGLVVPTTALPACRDGGVCQQAAGLADLATVAYDRPESSMNLSDVYVYDRAGANDAPAAGPGATWVDAEGPDYPWNWLTAGQPSDCPVLDNGLVRVRYDGTFGTPGFRVDVWNGAAYVEQGKMVVNRNGDISTLDNTFVSASLQEYTPERAVILVVLSVSTDVQSREKIYITMQRGEFGVTFEVYPALKASGTQADAQLIWTPALNAGVGDLNNSVLKIDSQGSGNWTPGTPAATQNTGPSPGIMASTAGTGAGTGNSGQFPGGTTVLGTGGFVGENWVSILRYPTAFNVVGAYQTTLIVLQAANAYIKYAGANSAAYGGGSQDIYEVTSQNGAGYLQCQVQFSATQAQQVLEAETLTLGTGTTATAADSATASGTGNNSTVANRTTDANFHVQKASWLNAFAGVFRVFARVRVAGGTGSFYVQAGGVGSTVQTTSTSYVWLDLGEFTTVAGGGQSFNLHAWNPSGSNIFVDRIEAYMVQDRSRTAAVYSGARDLGQAALMDSRLMGTVVAR